MCVVEKGCGGVWTQQQLYTTVRQKHVVTREMWLEILTGHLGQRYLFLIETAHQMGKMLVFTKHSGTKAYSRYAIWRMSNNDLAWLISRQWKNMINSVFVQEVDFQSYHPVPTTSKTDHINSLLSTNAKAHDFLAGLQNSSTVLFHSPSTFEIYICRMK